MEQNRPFPLDAEPTPGVVSAHAPQTQDRLRADARGGPQEGRPGLASGQQGRLGPGRGRAPEAQAREEVLEQAQNPLDPFGKGIECLNNIPSFADRYISGEVGLEIYIRVRPRGDDLNVREFVAQVCRKSTESDVNESRRGPTITEYARILGSEALKARRNVCQVDSPVLIDVIDTIEPTEALKGMTISPGSRFRTKVEWLEVFELIGVGGVRPLMNDTALPLLLIGDDWEVDHLQGVSIRGLDTVVMAHGQLPAQVVEGAAKVMRCVSYDETPVIRDIYDAVNANNYAPLFRLVLAPKCDRATIGVNFLNLDPKRVYVRFSAFELCERAGEV